VTRADPALMKALARAFRYQRMQEEGRYATISEMAEAERIERGPGQPPPPYPTGAGHCVGQPACGPEPP
jgi:hypothetical protein